MDCNLARQLLEYSRPAAGDLLAEDMAELERHLASCSECGPLAQNHRKMEAAVAQAMQAVSPTGAQFARLMSTMAAARKLWWRTTVVRTALAIVSLALAIGLVRFYALPTIDPSPLFQKAYELTGAGHANDEVRDGVTAWLHQAGSNLRAPEELNYKLLVFVEQCDFQGLQSVPTLLFVRGDATLRVYIVRPNAIKKLDSYINRPVEEAGCTMVARQFNESPGWVFVMVAAGAPPEAFFRSTRIGGPA